MAFDLDNEELRATRKLHKINDDLYEETSDKNVGSIEDSRTINVTNVILAIENVLQERKQDKKRIQELEKELEKANKQLDLDYVDDNYITKEKVKDKIEKYNRKMEEDVGHPNWIIADKIVINVLQELLEGGK